MTRLGGQFQTDRPVHDAIGACADALNGLGWHIEALEADRIAARPGSGHQPPLRVEVLLSGSGGATNVRIIGSDTDGHPLTREALIDELEHVRQAINASLDGAAAAPPQAVEARPQAREARPQRVEARPQATPARPQDRPARSGLERMAIAGIVVLSAIFLAVIAIALFTDSSEEPAARGAGGGAESTGAANPDRGQNPAGGQRRRNQGSASTGAAAAPTPASGGSAGSELNVSKEIRDGDQRFALTPTGVRRSGSYINLQIRIAAVGEDGYDGTGRVFLGTLVGTNGRTYPVESSDGPEGCEPPAVQLSNGQTRRGCLPFKVPPGVDAETFRYDPFFVGGKAATWDLR